MPTTKQEELLRIIEEAKMLCDDLHITILVELPNQIKRLKKKLELIKSRL
jgi:hypothetical protein